MSAREFLLCTLLCCKYCLPLSLLLFLWVYWTINMLPNYRNRIQQEFWIRDVKKSKGNSLLLKYLAPVCRCLPVIVFNFAHFFSFSCRFSFLSLNFLFSIFHFHYYCLVFALSNTHSFVCLPVGFCVVFLKSFCEGMKLSEC